MTPALTWSAARPLAMPRPTAATWAALGFLAAAFLLRLPNLGNPVIEIDEEFYLFVGDRILHGAIPFVDIWDRKPVGLFLVYAAIRSLGGDGINQYQIVATVFAGATAWIIHRIALPRAGMFGAVVAGLAYLLWIELVGGSGGQSPIFYNPLIAGSAWAVLEAVEAPDDRRFKARAMLAMALTGIAIQIKYTVVFEGFYFGLVLAWSAFRRKGTLAGAIPGITILALTALLPTLAVMFFYAAIGQLPAFWFANFVSVGLRSNPPPAKLHLWLRQDICHTLVLGTCFLAGLWQLRFERRPEARRWGVIVAGWIIAAFIGFASIGMYFYHYLLPLYVPLAVGAAPIFRRWPVGPGLAGIALWLPFSALHYPDFDTTARARYQIAAVQALLPGNVRTGCMAILNGPPILYQLTGACIRTRYAFPDHLLSQVEAPALGVSQSAELARLLSTQPVALVTQHDERNVAPASLQVLKIMRRKLYRHVGRVDFDEGGVDVWISRRAI